MHYIYFLLHHPLGAKLGVYSKSYNTHYHLSLLNAEKAQPSSDLNPRQYENYTHAPWEPHTNCMGSQNFMHSTY